jgi:transcriptional regulator GlxA family with amidase domain
MSIAKARQRTSPHLRKVKNNGGPPIPAVLDPRVETAIDFMNARLHRKIRLMDLAETAHLSLFRFSHLFKTDTGLSPGEYLKRLRMKKARNLLATTRLSIKEIMAAAGYDSSSNFIRHFRRSFGFAPSEYRRTAQEANRE